MNKWYRKIYAAGDYSIDELFIELGALLSAKKNVGYFLDTNEFDVSIISNDEFDILKQREFPDGFLYFNHLIDIGFLDDLSLDFAVTVVTKILHWLWHEKKVAAVASCDYEDLLPQNGGYKSKNIPWDH